MSNELTFELLQHSEFEDYAYEVLYMNDKVCIIWFKNGEWLVGHWNNYSVNAAVLNELIIKLDQLNESTKADKLFGFL